MSCPLGYNHRLAGTKREYISLELYHECSPEDIEVLVFVIVLMPYEVALDFGDLDIDVIDFCDDPRGPILLQRLCDLYGAAWFDIH